MTSPIGCVVIGYGAMHNFGWAHSAWISATPDLKLIGVCDTDPNRTAAAAQDYPGIRTYNDLAEVWRDADVQLVSIVTPHFTHCPLAVAAFEAGKHVVVEKAMCLNVAEATAMVEASQRSGTMFAVHHNRRHDGNFRRIKEIVAGGQIGDVFDIELYAGGYGPFEHGWYSEKAKSGGAFYFWGPHAVDWVLDLVGEPIVGVDGFFHKRVWNQMNQEDQVKAVIRFANGAHADVTWSHIAASGKPLWRILGTKGAIVDTGEGWGNGYEHQISAPAGGSLTLITYDGMQRHEERVPYLDCDWFVYWQEVADHLLRGGQIPVPGTQGRRVIGVFETAEKSSVSGHTEVPEFG